MSKYFFHQLYLLFVYKVYKNVNDHFVTLMHCFSSQKHSLINPNYNPNTISTSLLLNVKRLNYVILYFFEKIVIHKIWREKFQSIGFFVQESLLLTIFDNFSISLSFHKFRNI